MCNLAEEKYQVALIIRVASKFSVFDLLERLGTDQKLDATYAVIGELLEKGLIEDTGQFTLTPKHEVNKMYQTISSKSEEFEDYLKELHRMRVQPNVEGKPQGLNFRLVEQTLAQIKQTQDDEQKESLIASLKRYLALAQLDEISKLPGNHHQTAIAEAYLRMLYGEYLWEEQLWSSAIIQFLISSRLFKENDLLEKSRAIEARACEIVIYKYERIKQGNTYQLIGQLLDFAQKMDEIIVSVIRVKCRFPIFRSVSHEILREIKQKVDYLHRSDGDFITVIKREWTTPINSDIEVLSSIYRLLNESRLYIMNGKRLNAQTKLEEVLKLLEENRSEIGNGEASDIERNVREYLISLKAYTILDTVIRNLQSNDIHSANEQILLLNDVEFETAFPFYIADVFEKMQLVINSFLKIYEKKTIQLSQENGFEYEEGKPASSAYIENLTQKPEDQYARKLRLTFLEETIEQHLFDEFPFREWLDWGRSITSFKELGNQFEQESLLSQVTSLLRESSSILERGGTEIHYREMEAVDKHLRSAGLLSQSIFQKINEHANIVFPQILESEENPAFEPRLLRKQVNLRRLM